MINNYILVAWRQMLANKLYTAINIFGLTLGLVVYIFTSLLVNYERAHDNFWGNYQRTYTIGSVMTPTANFGAKELDTAYAGMGPLIKPNVPEVEDVARTVNREFLLSAGERHSYQRIRFADPELLNIFDFHYVEGDQRALNDTSSLVLTKSAAIELFGKVSAIGKTVELDHGIIKLHVTAVIEDPPPNTHFNTTISSFSAASTLTYIAPLEALNRITENDLNRDFDVLSRGNQTYVLLDKPRPREWLRDKLNRIYEQHGPENGKDYVASLKVRPLIEANTAFWEMSRIPVMDAVGVLALMVLIIAIMNYTNLATAQSLSRAREVGMRKVLGASRPQLLIQFLIESVTIAALSTLIALSVIEIVIPFFNVTTGRGLSIDYTDVLPWLLFVTLLVGITAGLYPAYLISQTSPLQALTNTPSKSSRGVRFRKFMMCLQFTISLFIFAFTSILFVQNQKAEESSNIYPKSQILTLQRLHEDAIQSRLQTLRTELLELPGVKNVSLSLQVPFVQSVWSMTVANEQGGEDSVMKMQQLSIDEAFFDTYDIPVLFGRNLSRQIAGDTIKKDVNEANVVLNETAAKALGFSPPQGALGKTFYRYFTEERTNAVYTIVGVVPDQLFMGSYQPVKSMVFMMDPENTRVASIRLDANRIPETLTAIENIWQQIYPDYPIQSQYLSDIYNETTRITDVASKTLGAVSVIALTLSLIGLFGLAAFVAKNRVKEIGIRKVMGASTSQIVRLLIWQFSQPVIWALVIGLPLSYLAAMTYLNSAANKLSSPWIIIVSTGVLLLLFSWLVVAVHAVSTARANPVKALRHQ